MRFYKDRILPHLVNLAMRNHRLQPYRERVISAAGGRVLEVGIGSGLNIAFYPERVSEIVGLEPADQLLHMAQKNAGKSRSRVILVEGSAEEIPLDRHSIDTIVMTWTLCSIPDATVALSEMRRVLKPHGQLLFVEHGLAPEEKVRKWQNRLTPLWKRFTGGCHLNRPIRDLIENAGFAMTQINTGYIEGPKTMTFFYQGIARPD
jgi:ubiquinone/menaquinone biosynthesis C-methylase UbiE